MTDIVWPQLVGPKETISLLLSFLTSPEIGVPRFIFLGYEEHEGVLLHPEAHSRLVRLHPDLIEALERRGLRNVGPMHTAMMLPMLSQMTSDEVAAHGKRFYTDELRRYLERDHFGEHCVINANTGDYAFGKTALEVHKEATRRFRDEPCYVFQIGIPLRA